MVNSKYLLRFLVALVLTGFTAWQGFSFYQQWTHYRETRFLFDTEVFVEVQGWGAKNAALEALDTMREIHLKLDRYSEDSDISLINRQAGQQPVRVSALTYEALRESLQIAGLTDGVFDPTIGPLVKVWGFGEEGSRHIPDPEAVQAALKLVDYRKVILNDEQKTVYLTDTGMSLDLGAVAKGYAVNAAVQILKSKNISSALVAAGGNIYALGQKNKDIPWEIGIRDPLQNGRVLGYVELEDQSIDTSGDYERFFWAEGKKYSHILDPRTGYPAQGISSCTVIMENPALADALATAVFVLGLNEGLELIERENATALLIASKGEQYLSEKMKGKIKTKEQILE